MLSHKLILNAEGEEVLMNLSVITLIFRILMILQPVWENVLELIEGISREDREDLKAAVEFVTDLPSQKKKA